MSLSRLTAGQRGANRLLRQLVTRDPSSVALLRELANAAWESGVRRADLIAHLDEWRNDGNPPRLLLIEPDPGLRAALGAELRARACPRLVVSGWRAIGARSEVQPEVRADVRPASRSLIRSGTIVVARPRIALRAAAKLPGASEIFTLALVGGSAALALAMQIRLPGVVAVLTRSRQIRRFARHLAACHHAAGLSVAVPDPADPAALCRATRIARLILADASCRSLSLETRAPVRELHVVSDETVRKLRRYVGGQMSEAR